MNDHYLFVLIRLDCVKIHTGNIIGDFLDMIGNIFIGEVLHEGTVSKFRVVFVDITEVLVIKFVRNVCWCKSIGIMYKII